MSSQIPFSVRLATKTDISAVQSIYAVFVEKTAATFEIVPPSVLEMETRFEGISRRFPWLVSQTPDGSITGFAYASAHSDRGAYEWSANTSIYINGQWHGQGVGRALYSSLIRLLKLQGFYNAFAGITLPNHASVALHQSLGYRHIGTFSRIGFKLGAWHPVSWWHLELHPLDLTPVQPRLPSELIGSDLWEACFQRSPE